MPSSMDLGTTAAKKLEHLTVIQSEVDALKRTYQGHFPLDSSVLQVLPQGIERAHGEQYGTSQWSFTAKAVTFQDCTRIEYFMKYVPGELGRQQLFGEFTGMTELWKLSPEFVVRPVAWGKLADTPKDCYFLLTEFKNFASGPVDPRKLARRVAELHKRSQARPATGGRFGFPCQTFDGARLQAVGWDASWASFFSRLLAEAHDQDVASNGVWPLLETAYRQVQSRLIPRLLGVLEEETEGKEDGQKVTPTLIHGDMWEGNVGTDAATGEPWIFDCAAYYGHHEMELGIWKAARHAFSRDGYVAAYMNEFGYRRGGSREAEAEDRIRLYSAKTNFMYSACFPGAQSRIDILNDFNYLLNKYSIDVEDENRGAAAPLTSRRTEAAPGPEERQDD
ncbi:hypothetical protein V2A60_000247 [Cordyceps javanica]